MKNNVEAGGSLPDLKGMFPGEIEDIMESHGIPRFRGRQVFRWIHKKHVDSFDGMTDLPVSLREELKKVVRIGTLGIITVQESKDGTVKYLFGLEDGNAIEAVRMEYRYGMTACVSSQVGCKMACRMCATGLGGFVRNLSVAEMMGEVLLMDKDARKLDSRIRNIVMMGSGEPLDNYDNVIRFMRLASEGQGLDIGFRKMAISTCGIVPGIRKLAGEGLPITLSISLHAPSDRLRDELMPINKRYPIHVIIDACKEYIQVTGRRVTFEYALIRGVNDRDSHAHELATLLAGLLCHVNLIPLNPVAAREYAKAGSETTKAFAGILKERGIGVTIRRELGSDIDAACGQLRRRYCTGRT